MRFEKTKERPPEPVARRSAAYEPVLKAAKSLAAGESLKIWCESPGEAKRVYQTALRWVKPGKVLGGFRLAKRDSMVWITRPWVAREHEMAFHKTEKGDAS